MRKEENGVERIVVAVAFVAVRTQLAFARGAFCQILALL